MPDMLVKLFELEDDWSFIAEQKARGILIRKPIGSERHLVADWVKNRFNAGWASEVEMAFSNRPLSCFVAIQNEVLIGFACYDATALDYFGPTGVAELARGQGTGKALLMACMLDMKLKGYGYAIIGWAGPTEFYRKILGAVEIPDSGTAPGLYKTMLTT
jgi:GNAT superfamily N-acetyltransferase